MDWLTVLGIVSATSMLVAYHYESRHHLFIAAFAVACAEGAAYCFLQGAWPLGIVEIVWFFSALGRWLSKVAPFHDELP